MVNKEKYLKNPSQCPFCDGTDVVSVGTKYYGEGDFVSNPPQISVPMNCENCGKDWFDIYQLIDIDPLDDIMREV
jgi:predicted Zn-ribbon and HTH transcriptional regulator